MCYLTPSNDENGVQKSIQHTSNYANAFNVNPNYVSANGALGTDFGLSRNGAIIAAKTIPPAIGDLRDGGIVFYIAPTPTDLDGDGDLDTGLVCAEEDLNPHNTN